MQSLEQRIRSVNLAESRRGYDRAAVDVFLENVADEVALLLANLRSESVRVGTLERELTILQGPTAGEVTDVFLSAASAKGRLLDEAYVKAEAILESARREAEAFCQNSMLGTDDLGTSHVERALEEAKAIEVAAAAIADKIKSDARMEAEKIVAAGRAMLVPSERETETDNPNRPRRSDGHAA
ncbi:MAG: DivIVA domain-containing protein [Actinomycetota bacterium]|nr:DivIVA domain-containing protein [Actinomycetota bacterium]